MKKQKTTLGRKENSKKNMFILLARDSRAVNLFVYYSASVCSDLAPRRIKGRFFTRRPVGTTSTCVLTNKNRFDADALLLPFGCVARTWAPWFLVLWVDIHLRKNKISSLYKRKAVLMFYFQ